MKMYLLFSILNEKCEMKKMKKKRKEKNIFANFGY